MPTLEEVLKVCRVALILSARLAAVLIAAGLVVWIGEKFKMERKVKKNVRHSNESRIFKKAG